MTEWIRLTADFIEADVIRWNEAVFARQSRRARQPIKIGTRRVTAEVLKGPDAEGWVALLVRRCEVLSETVIGQTVEVFKNGKSLRRSRNTLLRGEPERLLWSDETARDVVASAFPAEVSPPKPRRTRTPRTRKGSTRGRTKRTRR
jgi:hypothetical protein